MPTGAGGLPRLVRSTPFSGSAVTRSTMFSNPFVASAKALRFAGSYPPASWKCVTALLATRTDKARSLVRRRSPPLNALAYLRLPIFIFALSSMLSALNIGLSGLCRMGSDPLLT